MRRERVAYLLTNALLLIAAGLIAYALNGCRPYEVAKRKFATDVVDTSYVTVTTTIPRDSAVLVIKTRTDTTRVIERVRQGRATVTIIREPTNTTVIANCDSASKAQRVITKTVRQVWGVDPRYKDQAQTWRTVSYVLIGLIVAGVVAYHFFFRFGNRNQKPDGTATEPN